MTQALLEVQDLQKYFATGQQGSGAWAKAVDGLSFSVKKGEIFGLVGESGCGKTVTGKMILKLMEPTSGRILLHGQEITALSQKRFRPLRRQIQTVFQDPNAALDPKMTIEAILTEPLLLHGVVQRPFEQQEVLRLLEMVGLEPSVAKALPNELSSGQKQRIGIAKAISTHPGFILCDEPVSALDVSVQSQILNLLLDLKRRLSMTYLFISHSLGVVHHVSDRVGVMYLGKMVETGTTAEIFEQPLHPYTRALLAASPIPDPSKKLTKSEIKGEVPLCTHIPSGCPFHPRCPEARDLCRQQPPSNKKASSTHGAACHFA